MSADTSLATETRCLQLMSCGLGVVRLSRQHCPYSRNTRGPQLKEFWSEKPTGLSFCLRCRRDEETLRYSKLLRHYMPGCISIFRYFECEEKRAVGIF